MYDTTESIEMLLNEKHPINRLKSDTELYKVPESGNYNFKDTPLNDPRVWRLFAKGNTRGVFQLEKQLGQDWSRKCRPENIEHLAALVSILRPGPLESGFAESYCKRKNGQEEIVYLHYSLEPILKDTFGCLIYQEQAMRIAVDIAGFNEVQADNLRKAIGKKKPEEMVKVKKMFLEGAKDKKLVNEKEAEEIFGWIEKSVRYSFNKSHAVSYAMIAYLSAYQKTHFPTEFYCSWLTYSDWKPNPKEEIYELVQNARLDGIKVNPPDIRRKNIDFEIIGEKEIAFGLSHIRGVGASAIENISNIKNIDTFVGFLKSVKKLKRNVAESLIKSGACDCYGMSRAMMLQRIYVIFGRNEKDTENQAPEVKSLTPNEYEYVMSKIDKQTIQECLQGVIDNKVCVKKRIPTIESKITYINKVQADTNKIKSIWEKLYLGLNLTCSAADDVSKMENNITSCRDAHKKNHKDKVTMHVVIDDIRLRKTSEKAKNPGQEFAYLNISDNSGALQNVVCWPETWDKAKNDGLTQDCVVCLYGYKDCYNGREQVVASDIVVIG